jgi:hypothetical protein
MQISWRITHKDRKSFNLNGQIYTDVVTHVHWECKAFDENKEETISGTVPFDIHEIRYTNTRGEEIVFPSVFDAQNYIPFEEITDEVMLQWVKDFLQQDEITRLESVVTTRFDNNFIPNQR